MPRIPLTPIDLPAQVDRLKAMVLARKEMTRIIAKERITRALRMNVPSAAQSEILIGSRVSISWEKPENKWIGPCRGLEVKDKRIFIDLNGTDHQVYIDKVNACEAPWPVSTSDSTPVLKNTLDPDVENPSQSDVLDDWETILTRIRANPQSSQLVLTHPQ